MKFSLGVLFVSCGMCLSAGIFIGYYVAMFALLP
jgi:uncharacterized protein YneF (UPF0154 family)